MTMTADPVEMIDLADGVYVGEVPTPAMARLTIAAITASAIPVRPPREWFDNPNLGEVTPLTIESSGRVYGHVAGWKQDHIGMNGRVRAPHSRSNYAFFATGVLECDNGEQVNVGQITMVGGHAPLEASVAEAVAHYDNTESQMMDVTVGEDRHGIWVAGALRPEVDELKLRRLRASGVSGDWRPINGSLEMVAVCSVNVPGFPIPRARVAAGMPVALVAAGTTEIMEALVADYAVDSERAVVASALGAIDDRLRLVEGALLDRILERREALTAAIDAVSTDDPIDMDELEPPEAPDDPLEELRRRVHVDAGELAPASEELEVPAAPASEGTQVVDLDALRMRARGTQPVQRDVQESPTTPDPAGDLLEPAPAHEPALEELGVETGDLVPPAVSDVPPAATEPVDAMAASLRARIAAHGAWLDGAPIEYSLAECQQAVTASIQASLRSRVRGDVLVAAPKSWSADERRKAKGKGQTMSDGSFPIATKADWYRARQSVGRAKNPEAAKRHIKRRGRTLGIPKSEMANL